MKNLSIITFLFLILASAKVAEACSCEMPTGSLKEQVTQAKQRSAAIFVGKLTKLEQPKKEDGSFTGEVIAHFEVERIWKGGTKSEITVYTTNICCICGYPFEEGGRYLVYAWGKEKLSTTICTRTSPVGEKSDDEKYLGTPVIFEKKKTTLEPIS